ncbi:MAG: DNA-directed RNA polymerase subunit N [Nanoarchaeota archaeon]
MIIPIRCFSCSKPVAHLWAKYKERTAKGENPKKVLDDLGLERYCCRALFLGHVDLLKDIMEFKKD